MKKVLLVFSLAISNGLMSACKVTEVVKGPETAVDSVVSVGVNPSVYTMTVGQQQQFTAEVKNVFNAIIPNKSVVWSSSDPSKITVTATGVVSAISPGAAIIRASSNGVIGQAPVVVAEASVSTIIITPNGAGVFLGQTVTPKVELRGPNNQVLTNRFMQWSSSNPSVATVNQLGVITTVNVGTSTITVTSEGKTASLLLTVIVIPAAVVEISVPTPIKVGRTSQLGLDIRDIGGTAIPPTGRSITWSSSDASIATVTNTGLVRGLSTGNVSVAVLVDGKLSVVNTTIGVVDIDTIAITPDDTTSLMIGFTKQLTATAFDEDNVVLDALTLAGRTFFWASETPSIAAVSNTGLVIGLSEGEAIIKVSVNGVVTRKKIKIIL